MQCADKQDRVLCDEATIPNEMERSKFEALVTQAMDGLPVRFPEGVAA